MSKFRAKKSFGQNFLIDDSITEKIIEAAGPESYPAWLEVGPGKGVLTKHFYRLFQMNKIKFFCVELDYNLVSKLQNDLPGINIFQEDILKFRLVELLMENSIEKINLITNLPFNISSPFIQYMFDNSAYINKVIIMLQKEIGDRLQARISTKDYSALTVTTRYFCDVKHLFNVPSRAFAPRPKVDASILELQVKDNFRFEHEKIMFGAIKSGFGQRRKKLRNSLKAIIDTSLLDDITEIDLNLRAENLTVENFQQLAKDIYSCRQN